MRSLFKVINKSTREYVKLGSPYNQKTSWRIYPKVAISTNADIVNNPDNYEVEVYELVLTDRLEIKL